MSIIKRKRKVRPIFMQLFLIGLTLVAIFLLLGAGGEVLTMLKIKKQAKIVKQELERLKEENITLKDKSKKLSDPNYVQTYARGNYMFTKEGEQIFYLPNQSEEKAKTEEKEDQSTKETTNKQ